MSTVELDLERRDCPICWGDNLRFERMVSGYRLEKCLDCGMVFSNPQHTLNSLDKIYEIKDDPYKYVELYERIHTPEIILEYEKVLQVLEARCPEKGRLLDFACAAGYFYERALARGWEAHGLDIGDWCKLATERRGVPNMHIGHLKEQNFPDGYFDVVVAAEVLEHLPHPKVDLAEIRRILKPHGILWVTVPNYQNLAIILNRCKFSLNTPPQHINYFTPKTLRTLMQHTGYEVKEMFSGGGLNWENIIGKEIESEILDAYDPDAFKTCSEEERLVQLDGLRSAPPRPAPEPAPEPVRTGWKKWVYPIYEQVFNRWAKVGMGLLCVAHRPPGDFPG